jgi:hypothetical protein
MLANWKRISIALGLWPGRHRPGVGPAGAPRSDNQQAADAVAGALRGSPTLAGPADRDRHAGRPGDPHRVRRLGGPEGRGLARARASPARRAVADRLRVASDPRVQAAQFMAMARSAQPPPARASRPPARASRPPARASRPDGLRGQPPASRADAPRRRTYGRCPRRRRPMGRFPRGGAYGGMPPPIEGATLGPIGAYDNGMAIDGPAPEGVTGGAAVGAGANLPNYAWPSYAPYPNFSAVGYPTTYPWQPGRTSGRSTPTRGPPGLEGRDPAVGRRDLVARLQEALHPPVLHPYPFGLFAY